MPRVYGSFYYSYRPTVNYTNIWCCTGRNRYVFPWRYGRINTCYRLLETMTDTRLLNEGDERGMTPLHMASRNGHVRVVDLLLHRGALCQKQESRALFPQNTPQEDLKTNPHTHPTISLMHHGALITTEPHSSIKINTKQTIQHPIPPKG